jgi:ribonuclease E
MLDATNENTPDSNESTESGANSAAGPAAADAAAPAKKAARRPAQKRTAKKAAAPAGPAEPETSTASGEASRADVPSGDASTAEPAAPATARARKAPAKRAAKKVAAPPADTGTTETVAAAGSGTAGTDRSAPSGDPTPTSATDTAPAKKTARKRTTKATKATKAAASADVESTETAVDAPSAPALSAPVVLFQPPSEVPAPTRRRRATKAVAPVEQIALDEADSDSIDAEATDAADSVDEADDTDSGQRPRRRRGRRGRGSRTADAASDSTAEIDVDAETDEDVDDGVSESELEDHAEEVAEAALSASARRRRRRRRSSTSGDDATEDDPPNTVVHVRETRSSSRGGGGGGGSAADDDGVRGVKGSTRLEAKRQRRRDNRDTGRRRAPILTEAEFLARRESVERVMAVRQTEDRTQIAVLEDGILVEHYVTRASASSAVGNVYLGRVQNVLPSMEAAFVDIGRGRNGVLYAGEVNWDAAGLEGKARSIENALNPGDAVLVQVTKDPIGHKGARLTSQVSLAGRFLVFVPGGGMTGISRRLPDVERTRLKAILKKVVPEDAGVIVRTAAEGASEEDLVSDVERLKEQWAQIQAKTSEADSRSGSAPSLVYGEPDLAIRVVRDVFNDDFSKLTVAGADTHATITSYVADVAPDLADRITLYTGTGELFHDLRVDEQLAKALDRKVWLPSGGSLVIDRTEAMTVVDVNTGKYTGSGGNLEQTVTRNNLEAAEEIVRQLRLRDIGGIIVIDFIDMVLESNRDLVLRRLTECLGRDRTKHQVAEVTSLGLVQMTRKRVGEGLLEAFSEPCPHCNGRGLIIHAEPIDKKGPALSSAPAGSGPVVEEDRTGKGGRRNRRGKSSSGSAAGNAAAADAELPDELTEAERVAETERRRAAANAIAAIAAASGHRDELAAEVIEAAADELAESIDDASLMVVTVDDDHRDEGDAGAAEDAVSADAAAPSRNSRARRRRGASRPAGPPVSTSVSAASTGT